MSEAGERSCFYDLNGLPIDVMQAQALMRDWEARLLAETQIETIYGTLWVATVHMVMDQADPLFDEHVPLLYATRVHGVTHRRGMVGFRGKYVSPEAAVEGHMAVLHDVIRDLGADILAVLQKPIKWAA